MPSPWASGTRKSRAPWITRVGVLKLVDGRAGGLVEVDLRAFPGRAAELPLGEPEFLGRAVHAGQVEDARVADQGFEAVGVAGDPVDHEPAVRPAGRRHPIDPGTDRSSRRGRALVEVFVDPAGPVAADLVGELLAVAGRAPRVDRHDGVAWRGEQSVVPAVMPLVVPGPLRAAVDQEDDRVFLRSGRSRAA